MRRTASAKPSDGTRILEVVLPDRSCEAAIRNAFCIEDILEAREALDILASLPDRQREDLTLVVAGFSYDEIGEMTSGRTFNTVRKSVDKAHAGVARNGLQGTMSIRARGGAQNRRSDLRSGNRVWLVLTCHSTLLSDRTIMRFVVTAV